MFQPLWLLFNIEDHFHFHIFTRSSKYKSFSYSFHLCHFHHRVYYEQWLALQLAWLAWSIDSCVRSSLRSGRSIPGQAWIFFRFLINRLGCLFNWQDHFHFHIFIRSSKYESFLYIFHLSLQLLPVLYHGVLGFILKVNMVVESGHSLILMLWSSREYSLINATAI